MVKNFENLSKGENAMANRCYYLAFLIVQDTEFFGVYSNYYLQNGFMDNETILKVAEYLSENNINSLSRLMEFKSDITEFLVNLE